MSGVTATRATKSARVVFFALLACRSASIYAQARCRAIGSIAEDRARIDEITGVAQAGPQCAAPGVVKGTISPTGIDWRVLVPELRVVWNSDIPYSMNDGPLWAGRGANTSLKAGAALSYQGQGFVIDAAIAPTYVYSGNRPFDIVPGRASGRSTYSSPWHLTSNEGSADLPLRFGDRPLKRLDPGESGISVRLPSVVVGATTASEWWGPGIRNALVLSNNAPGIPRVFVESARPVRTPIGDFAGKLVWGTLTKSVFFDTLASSNYRSFSGVLLTYRVRADSGLTFGLARAVYAPMFDAVPPPETWLNALRWRPPAGSGSRQADQIASLFGRWVLPQSGLEAYAEWARMELPHSFAELIETPYNTDGYTLGFQWAMPWMHQGRIVRIQSEISYLEQNIVYPDRPPADFYTGRAALQGYTQRGEIIGAAIGPGGSSQWLAADYIVPRFQLGLFLGRIRWEDNALYRQQFATYQSHDVSIFSGLRGAYRLSLVDLSAELTVARRLNYLFQTGAGTPENRGPVDVQNITLATRLSPR